MRIVGYEWLRVVKLRQVRSCSASDATNTRDIQRQDINRDDRAADIARRPQGVTTPPFMGCTKAALSDDNSRDLSLFAATAAPVQIISERPLVPYYETGNLHTVYTYKTSRFSVIFVTITMPLSIIFSPIKCVMHVARTGV